MGPLVVVVLGLLAIATVRLLADRIGVAAPLLLVLLGVGVALLPGVPVVEIEPEWILAGILPPLLFSSAVAMPAMEFRRAFGAVSGLSVLLVVLSAGAIGLLLTVPDLGLAGGIALGAILSPTDATATAIVRRTGVTSRVVTVLEGEGLLNDATALVLLRAAIAAGAASVSIGGVLGEFALAVVVAVVLGVVVGRLGLMARRRVADPTVNTVLSLATPFVASLPAEALGTSGVVAAVAAGLVTGHGAIRHLSPQHRLSDKDNWRGAGAGGAGRAADRRRHRGARPVRRRPGRRGLQGTPGRPGRAPGPGALVRQTRPRPPRDDRGAARRAARRPRRGPVRLGRADHGAGEPRRGTDQPGAAQPPRRVSPLREARPRSARRRGWCARAAGPCGRRRAP